MKKKYTKQQKILFKRKAHLTDLYDGARKKVHFEQETIFNKKKLKSVPYPRSKSEAEIQAELMIELKKIGFYNTRIEVPADFCFSRIGTKIAKSRFDLVVFDSKNTALVIIEVKKQKPNRKKKGWSFANEERTAKQVEKYAEFIPDVILCYGETDIKNTIKVVCRHLKHNQLLAKKYPSAYSLITSEL